jgi:hypothetical protein
MPPIPSLEQTESYRDHFLFLLFFFRHYQRSGYLLDSKCMPSSACLDRRKGKSQDFRTLRHHSRVIDSVALTSRLYARLEPPSTAQPLPDPVT